MPITAPALAFVINAPPAPSVVLLLKVEPMIDALVLVNPIAPPPPVPDWLDENVELVIATIVVASQYIAPAKVVATLPMKSDEAMEIDAVGAAYMAPPGAVAVLFANTEPWMLTVPAALT